MLGVTVAVLVLAVYLFLLWRKKQFSVLKELNIPGPEPNLIFGNLTELLRKTPLQCHKEWIERYGKVFGYYVFTMPVVVVADVELLKKIQVSDFHKFINRPFSTGSQGNMELLLQLVNLRDRRWKEIRSILTPSFTTSKMKLMAPIIHDAIDALIVNLDEKARIGEPLNAHKLYQGLTLDVISRTAFGVQAQSQKDGDNPLLLTLRRMLGGGLASDLMILTLTFPALGSTLRVVIKQVYKLFHKGEDPVKRLSETIGEMVNVRRAEKSSRRPDLLQLMIEARMAESDIQNASGSNLTAGDEESNDVTPAADSRSEKSQKAEKFLRYMDDREIHDNAILFLIAGYETTSTALAFITNALIHFPEVQDRMREEVNNLINREGKLDYSSVQQLQYMDQVVNESLRMFPPVYLFVNRETREDVDFGNFRLKKGITVQVPVHYLHYDPEYWDAPETFDPDRFSEERKSRVNPLAFQTFGAGPRNCVGMRFAQMEIKMALAKILQKYRLVTCEESDKFPTTVKVTPVTMIPAKGVFLKAIPL